MLEPQAIIQTLQHFLPHLQNQNVLQKSDITTIVQYMNKQGDTLWGEPTIDLFASVHNHKSPVFCAWLPRSIALAVDALSISWEKNVGICISTNMPKSKGIQTYESVQLSTDSDSSNVAKKTLVHRASAKVSGKSIKTANTTKSTLSTKNNHVPSKH
ncbi:unnamed protein product [Mytilus coruscus]|uniref:Uncharacterized protein n=1 Tax=Mytilus coruscus TaxID=42192 RepID=A0A6J8DPU0_MYTCO|nr:unnamed protein product [Mytilus coruscus]